MDYYIFLTTEGYNFQPNSDAITPDIENMQVIGFSKGNTTDEAFDNLLIAHSYLKETSFNRIFCYKLDNQYEENRKDYEIGA
jgi:hypothetical protein